jgi:hypothetical protein
MDVYAAVEIRTPDRLAGIQVNTPTTLTRTGIIFEHVIICSKSGHDDDDEDDSNNNKFSLKETMKA